MLTRVLKNLLKNEPVNLKSSFPMMLGTMRDANFFLKQPQLVLKDFWLNPMKPETVVRQSST